MTRRILFLVLAGLLAASCATGLTSLTLSEDLTVGDDATVTDDLTVTGAQTVGETLEVTGATTLSSTLAVTGLTTTTGGELEGWSTKTDDYAATTAECGEIIAIATDGKMVTLPAAAAGNKGCCITVINTGADGAVHTGFSVNADDAVFGSIPNSAADSVANGTDNNAFGNTKATANKGDRCTVCSDGSTGWFVRSGVGIWASTAQ